MDQRFAMPSTRAVFPLRLKESIVVCILAFWEEQSCRHYRSDWPAGQLLPDSGFLSFGMALCMRRYTNITGPWANQPLTLVLFEGMTNPARRTSNGEQGQPGAVGQVECVLQHGQDKVKGWGATGDCSRFAYDRMRQRQRWRGGIGLCEQGEQRHGTWITVWVQSMSKAGKAFAAPQTFGNHQTYPWRLCHL